MNQDIELYDKVIYYKGRVWTIYALSGNRDGVFAYQGLKPTKHSNMNLNQTEKSLT